MAFDEVIEEDLQTIREYQKAQLLMIMEAEIPQKFQRRVALPLHPSPPVYTVMLTRENSLLEMVSFECMFREKSLN